jgi:hypothetical protein
VRNEQRTLAHDLSLRGAGSQVAKVDPNRSAKMADRIKAMMSALTVMEYDLRKASAAADLLQGMQ